MKKYLILAVLSLAFTVQVCAQNVISSSYNTSTNLTKKDFKTNWRLYMEGLGVGFLEDEMLYWNYYSIGASRFIKEKTTFTASIGYSSRSMSDWKIDYEAEMKFITIPLELGYYLTDTESLFKMKLFAGSGINYCLKSEASIGDNEIYTDLDGKIGLDARVGVKLYIGDFGISASYQVPLNSKQENFTGEDGYIKVKMCYGL